MSSFGVDVLLKALEELQKGGTHYCSLHPSMHFVLLEKSQNERLLTEEQFKVKQLESSEASSMFALTQSKDRHDKSREKAEMEEQRVEQTQEQIQQ